MAAPVQVTSTANPFASASSGGNTIGGPTIMFPSGADSATPSGALSSIGQQVIIGVLVLVLGGIVVAHLRKG